jgi:hypothetical protein
LVDQTLSEKPFYAITEDEDLVYWSQYLLNPAVDLGNYHSVEQAISVKKGLPARSVGGLVFNYTRDD